MALFDFLKSVLKKAETKEPEEETVALSALHAWLKHKQENLRTQEDAAVRSFKEEILQLRGKLDEHLPILKNVDIEAKKVDAKVKLIVKNNLKSYTTFVERLLKNIDDLEYTTMEEYARKIDDYYADFLKKSNSSYGKSNYLVGKELVAVKEPLVRFYKRAREAFEENKDLIATSHTVASIRSKLDSIDESTTYGREVTASIAHLNKRITEIIERKKIALKNIEELTNSKEYAELVKKEEEVEKARTRLKKEYADVKQLIDFKGLANEFHSNAHHMKLIKAYKEDFETTIETDAGERLLALLQEARLPNETIRTRITGIKNKEKELRKEAATMKTIPETSKEIEKIEAELETAENQKAREAALKEKLSHTKENVIASIKEELMKINVRLEKT